MKAILYVSAIGSLMYAPVCTCHDLGFVIKILGRFKSNPGIKHWQQVNKVLKFVHGTKGLMFTYKKSDALDIVGYSLSDFADYEETRKSTLANETIAWKLQTNCDNISYRVYTKFVVSHEAVG